MNTSTDDPRRSIDAQGCEHATPIPTASRIGPLLVSSVIAPFDVGTRTTPEGPSAQVANLFTRAERILVAGGAGWEHVARMTFYVADASSRDAIDEAWAAHFPDPGSRPARTTLTVALPPAMEVQCEFLAVVTGRAQRREEQTP